MLKTRVLVVALSVVLLSAVAAYFFLRSADVYEAIPQTALAAIETNNWNQLGSQWSLTATGIAFKKTPAAQKLFSEINLLQQLLSSDNALTNAVVSGKTVASLHLTSATDYDFLFTTSLGSVNDNTLLNRIQSSPLAKKVSVRIFKNQKVVDVFMADGRQLSFTLLKGVFIFSFTPFLTENGIAALGTGSNLNSNKNFQQVKQNRLSTSARLYFDFSKTDVILPLVVLPQQSKLLKSISHTGTWGRYDVAFTNGSMVLDGVVATETSIKTDGKNLLADNLLKQVPDYAAYLELTQTDTSNTNYKNYFAAWAGGHQANVILEPLSNHFNDQCIFILGTAQPQQAQKDLVRWMSVSGSPVGPVDTFQRFLIFRTYDNAVINQLSNNSMFQFAHPYFTITGSAVIFANSADVLKLLLEKTNKGETIDKDNDFKQTEFTRMGLNSTLQYANIHRSSSLLQGLLLPASNTETFLSAFSTVLCVSNIQERLRYSRLVFYSGGSPLVTAGLQWRTKLQTLSSFTPQIVFNNRSGEYEVFTQDTGGNVYLISKSGEILFTKKIDGAILGDVRQIDYYHNGALQYIFNTAQEVFIIDRLGNYISQYPLRLSATANCGMLVQSEGYYIPCSNGNIYGYAYNGKPLSGWSPKSGTGTVQKPLLGINSVSQNFILAVNTQHQVFLLDQKGKTIWTLTDLPETVADFEPVYTGNSFKLLSTAGKQLLEVSDAGTYTTKNLIDTATAFAVIQLSDSTYRYYYSHAGQIRCYNQHDIFQQATQTDSFTVTSLRSYSNNEQKYVIVADSTRTQLRVVDALLKQVCSFNYSNTENFTLTGTFNAGRLHVVAADKVGNVLCYRLK